MISGLGNRKSERAGARLLEIARGSDVIELRKAAISAISRRIRQLVRDLHGVAGPLVIDIELLLLQVVDPHLALAANHRRQLVAVGREIEGTNALGLREVVDRDAVPQPVGVEHALVGHPRHNTGVELGDDALDALAPHRHDEALAVLGHLEADHLLVEHVGTRRRLGPGLGRRDHRHLIARVHGPGQDDGAIRLALEVLQHHRPVPAVPLLRRHRLGTGAGQVQDLGTGGVHACGQDVGAIGGKAGTKVHGEVLFSRSVLGVQPANESRPTAASKGTARGQSVRVKRVVIPGLFSSISPAVPGLGTG